MLLVTDGITGRRQLKAYGSGNIAGIYLVQFCTLIGMHLQDTSHTLFLSLCRIQHVGTGVHRTGINAEESKLSNEWVSHNLKGKCRERLLVGRMSFNFIAVHIHALNGRDVSRCRHKLQDGIQKLLYTLVAVSRTAAHRNCLAVTGGFSKSSL